MLDEVERGTRAPMRFAYRELATPGMGWVATGISFGLLAIVVALGPMDTLRTLTLVQRLAFFGLTAVLVVPGCFAFGFFILYVMRNRALVYHVAALALMCAVVAASSTALTIVLYGTFHGGSSLQASFAGVYAFDLLITGVGTGLALYALYLRITRTIPRTNSAGEDAGGSPSEAPPAEAPPAEAADQESPAPQLRLPADIGQDIVYVHVSGHYVEVVTTAGTAVVLMRLSDVARALEGRGMQTHRSYWVAYRHIVRLQTDDHRVVLHVTGGRTVPVSRSFRDDVRVFMANREDGSPPSGPPAD